MHQSPRSKSWLNYQKGSWTPLVDAFDKQGWAQIYPCKPWTREVFASLILVQISTKEREAAASFSGMSWPKPLTVKGFLHRFVTFRAVLTRALALSSQSRMEVRVAGGPKGTASNTLEHIASERPHWPCGQAVNWRHDKEPYIEVLSQFYECAICWN